MSLSQLLTLVLISPYLLLSQLNASEVRTIYSTPKKSNKSLERSIYIMPEDLGWQLVEQCTRTVYYPDSFWRVTFDQVDAIEQLLRKHLDKKKETGDTTFIPGPLESYKRQYVGFEMNGSSYYYGNFFPRDYDLEVDPLREAVVICRGDKRFWGVLFNIDTFTFESIERNDKLTKLKGPVNPFLQNEPAKDSENELEDDNQP